jgi:hypothetical protein
MYDIKKGASAVIIMDIQLLDEDGYEITEYIKFFQEPGCNWPINEN